MNTEECMNIAVYFLLYTRIFISLVHITIIHLYKHKFIYAHITTYELHTQGAFEAKDDTENKFRTCITFRRRLVEVLSSTTCFHYNYVIICNSSI